MVDISKEKTDQTKDWSAYQVTLTAADKRSIKLVKSAGNSNFEPDMLPLDLYCSFLLIILDRQGLSYLPQRREIFRDGISDGGISGA